MSRSHLYSHRVACTDQGQTMRLRMFWLTWASAKLPNFRQCVCTSMRVNWLQVYCYCVRFQYTANTKRQRFVLFMPWLLVSIYVLLLACECGWCLAPSFACAEKMPYAVVFVTSFTRMSCECGCVRGIHKHTLGNWCQIEICTRQAWFVLFGHVKTTSF